MNGPKTYSCFINVIVIMSQTSRDFLNKVHQGGNKPVSVIQWLLVNTMNQRFHRTRQYCTELREQLNEANNKISRTFLVCLFFSHHKGFFFFFFTILSPDNCCSCLQEKAILSTQVLKLEKELKKLKGKMSDRENQVSQTLMKTHHTSDIRYDVSCFGEVS